MNSTGAGQSLQLQLRYTRLLAISSASCLSLLSVVTTTSNILLLIAIWKDPLKCFKSSAKYFIVGLSVADLITGLTTEPFFATYYFTQFFKHQLQPQGLTSDLYYIGGIISSVALKYSFLVVLALSWSQFTAITWPHKYRRLITNRNIVVFMVLAFLYLVVFTAVQFMGILSDITTFHKIDLANSTLLSVNLLVVSLLLYGAHRRRAATRDYSTKPLNSSPAKRATSSRIGDKRSRERTLDQQFTIISIYLGAILLLCALPHVVTVYIFVYNSQKLTVQSYLNLLVSLRVSDILLFIKVCTDPFIYAWRLPNYRKTLVTLFRPRRNHGKHEQEKLVGIQLIDKSSSSPVFPTNGNKADHAG